MPPVALQATLRTTESPVLRRPYAVNCRLPPVTTLVLAGTITICVTGLTCTTATRESGMFGAPMATGGTSLATTA